MVNNSLIVNIVCISKKTRHNLTALVTSRGNPSIVLCLTILHCTVFNKEAFMVHYGIHGYSL